MFPAILALLLAAALPTAAQAQALSERGYVEGRVTQFLQKAPNHPEPVLGEVILRQEVFLKPVSLVQFAGGVDLRADSNSQIEDEWRLDFEDRGILRPRLSVRRLTATITHGPFTLDLGKQFIRWGKADILNPTDRFAPRDFLNVIDSTFLAVTGAHAVLQVGPETFEGVWVPRFTPSRMPLLHDRWTVLPPELAGVPVVDVSGPLPTTSQEGVRWSHVGASLELSLSVFDGLNHLPNLQLAVKDKPASSTGMEAELRRIYPEIRSFGGGVAVPTSVLTIKGEAAYIKSRSSISDDYVLYVIQLERQTGEWVLAGGYADEVVTRTGELPAFAPDRALARSFLGRATYTIDSNHGFAFEAAVHRSGEGAYGKGEYSQTHGSHWRTTVTGMVLGGDASNFFGRYRHNANMAVAVRYSF